MIAHALAVAAALAAGPTPLLDAPHADSVAVAGNEVIVTRPGARGRVTVDALSVEGGTPRRLLTAAGIGKHWGASASVAASTERVAVQVFYARVDDAPGGLRWRLYAGPTSGPLTKVVDTGMRGWLPDDPAVDGNRILVPETRFTSLKTRALLFEGAAAPHVLPWGRKVNAPVALAGDHVAYTGAGGNVFVADLKTGARQVKVKTSAVVMLDVDPDGRVITDRVFDGLLSAAPGVPQTDVPGGKDMFLPRFAGARVAAVQSLRAGLLRPVVLDPGASVARPVGVRTFDLRSLDADTHGVAYIANGCVLYAPVDASAPKEPPAGPCPRVEVAVDPAGDRMRGRTVRVLVTCVAAPAGGCHGHLALRLRGPAGGRRFAVAAGHSKHVNVTLTRRAAKLVRRLVHDKSGALLKLRYRAAGARRSPPGIGFFINRVS